MACVNYSLFAGTVAASTTVPIPQVPFNSSGGALFLSTTGGSGDTSATMYAIDPYTGIEVETVGTVDVDSGGPFGSSTTWPGLEDYSYNVVLTPNSGSLIVQLSLLISTAPLNEIKGVAYPFDIYNGTVSSGGLTVPWPSMAAFNSATCSVIVLPGSTGSCSVSSSQLDPFSGVVCAGFGNNQSGISVGSPYHQGVSVNGTDFSTTIIPNAGASISVQVTVVGGY